MLIDDREVNGFHTIEDLNHWRRDPSVPVEERRRRKRTLFNMHEGLYYAVEETERHY